MRVSIPAIGHVGIAVRFRIEPGYGAACHRDGFVTWRKSPRYERFEDLAPSSDDGPYALGGVIFCRSLRLAPEETLESAAVREFSHRGPSSEIVYGQWRGTGRPQASISWTDGVCDVLSILLRLRSDVHLAIEYSVFARRDEAWIGPRPYEDALSLLRAIRSIDVTESDGETIEIE